jgi:hypothetical protein
MPAVKETLTGFARVFSQDGHIDLRRSPSARRPVSFMAGSFTEETCTYQ